MYVSFRGLIFFTINTIILIKALYVYIQVPTRVPSESSKAFHTYGVNCYIDGFSLSILENTFTRPSIELAVICNTAGRHRSGQHRLVFVKHNSVSNLPGSLSLP